MAMVLASNTLAQLVPTEVLKEQTIPAMAKCISIFIKVDLMGTLSFNNYYVVLSDSQQMSSSEQLQLPQGYSGWSAMHTTIQTQTLLEGSTYKEEEVTYKHNSTIKLNDSHW